MQRAHAAQTGGVGGDDNDHRSERTRAHLSLESQFLIVLLHRNGGRLTWRQVTK